MGRPTLWTTWTLLASVTIFLRFHSAAPAPAVTELKSPAGPGSAEPNIAVASGGRVFLSWIEPNAKGHALRYSVRGAQGWSAPRTIAQGTNWFVSPADFPAMTVMPNGTLAANWLVAVAGPDSEAYNINIVLSRDNGATWSKPIVPHRDLQKRQHGFLSWAPTPEGKLGLIWLDGRKMPSEASGDMVLMYTTLAPDGTLGPEMAIDGRVCECCQTSMAATASGLLAVYRDRSEKEVRDISISRLEAGRWSSPQPLSRDGWMIDGCPVNGPAISSDGNHVAVAWFTAVEEKPQVQLLTSADGGKTFGRKIRIDGGNPAGRVDVVSLPGGAAAVSWIERTSQGPQVHLRQVGANGAVLPPIAVSGTAGARSGGFPRMERTGAEIVIAWTDSGEPSRVRTAVVTP